MKLLKLRLSACWNILTQKRKHWYFVSIDTDDLIKLIKKEDFELDIIHHKLQFYNVMELVRMHKNSFDDIDFLEQRLKFEHEAEQFNNTKRQRQ